MIKTISINEEQEVTLSNNVGWLLVYKDQFGQDIVPSLIPILNAGIDLVYSIYTTTGGRLDKDTIAKLDTDVIEAALYKLAGFEMVDFLNVVWAMAKNADDKIPEPRKWLNQFEVFPMDLMVPAVFDLLYKGMVSSKNSKRLQELIGTLKPEA